MIRNEDELRATKHLLAIAESAYDALRAELLPDKPKAFELLSQGYKDEIAGLTAVIQSYLKNSQPSSNGDGSLHAPEEQLHSEP